MHINRSLLNWGVFLIALGGIPLAVDQGWIDSDIAADLGQLWPLILVGIGLGLILRWTPFAWFGGALVAATFGIIFGAAIVSVPDDDIATLQGIIPAIAVGACGSGDAGPASTGEGGPANADVFELDATLSCGELAVGRAAGADWSVDAAHATDDAPVIDESDLDGATAQLGLSQRGGNDLVFLGSQAQSDWRVGVPRDATLSVGLTLNAARGDIDAGAGPLARLNGTLNASDAVIDLADAATPQRADVNLTLNASDVTLLLPDGDLDANLTLNASSLAVCVPQGAPLQVEIGQVLSSDDLSSSGLEEGNPTIWRTPDFSFAGDHILLSVSSTVSSLSIERPETCS